MWILAVSHGQHLSPAACTSTVVAAERPPLNGLEAKSKIAALVAVDIASSFSRSRA